METLQLEEALIELLGKQQFLQWENYASAKRNDLNQMNIEIYSMLKDMKQKNLFSERKAELFERIYNKYCIENDPAVARLRNKLDDRRNYATGLNKKDPGYKVHLAKKMKDDVIELLQTRNDRAREMGFPSYPDLLFYSEELEKELVIKQVEEYVRENITQANNLINKYQLTWQNWFRKLSTYGPLKHKNPSHYIDCLFAKLGLEPVKESLHFVFKDQPIYGATFGISIPDDIRILLRPVKSPMNCKLLFHECGHAINYASNTQDGLFKLQTTSFDEIMAVLFETVGIIICLSEQEQEVSNDIKLLEAVRCGISFLFEMELWKQPEDAEDLFREKQELLAMKPENEAVWALDTFRYIDPVYIHNYVLGEIYTAKILQKLKNEFAADYQEWERVIETNFMNGGRKRSFTAKYNDFMKKTLD